MLAAMATRVSFTSKSGGELHGARSEPAGAGKAGGVVVVQEWWGLSQFVQNVCDRLADAGFVALAPDLYHGGLPASKAEAAQAMGALDKGRAVGEIGDAVAYLTADARCSGKVAVMGFCLGGALTLAAASRLEGITAALPFYGIPDLPMDAFAHVKAPIQAHFAKKDDWAKASVAAEIQKKVRSGGGSMDLFVYDAGHAFMRSTDPEVYDAENARVAWDRAAAFLKKHLGQP
jgi:carboxymethylenebutenolidase